MRPHLRLGTRLFLLVVLSSLLPAALVLLAGWLQTRQQIRVWTIPSVEAALDSSLQTNRRAFDRLQVHLESEGRILAESRVFPSPEDTTGLAALLLAGCRQFGIDVAQVYVHEPAGFRLLASQTPQGSGGPDISSQLSPPLGSAAGPQRPPALRVAGKAGRDGDYLAVPTFLWNAPPVDGGPPQFHGALVLGVELGPGYYDRLHEVTTGLQFYRRLEEVGQVLRAGYGLLALGILALSLGLSLWIARRVARSISRPVEGLVRAMDGIGVGAAGARGSAEAIESSAGGSSIPEMARLAGAFSSMRSTLRSYEERLRESERIQGAQETARFVAHEIRNTLTPVRAALSVLERQIEALAPEEKRRKGERAVELIRREADRMASLAGAFSEYAHFPERRPVVLDPAALMETLAREEVPPRIALEVERAGAELRPEGPDSGFPRISADRDELERLFRNLIRNAVESIPAEGRIRLLLAATPQGEMRIVLEDSGCGMDAETLRKAFQPGFTTKGTGTGLGLALVRSSLSHYGGTIRMESAPGQGTRVTLTIPADRPGVGRGGSGPSMRETAGGNP